MNPTVVRDVNDQGVFRDAGLVEMIHQGSTGLVEPFAHGVVLGDPFLHSFGQILLVQALGRVVRSVGKERSVPNEEGFLLFDRPIDEVEDRIHSRPPNLESVVAMSAPGFGESAGHSFGEASALVGAFPPFSALVADVPLLGEPMRKAAMFVYIRNDQLLGIFTRSLGVSQVFRSVCRIISGDLVLVGIQTGKQGGEGRAAQGGRDVSATEQGALGGQFVEVRGFDMRMPHETVIGVALVVREDEDDVGLLGPRGSRENEEDGKEIFFHGKVVGCFHTDWATGSRDHDQSACLKVK